MAAVHERCQDRHDAVDQHDQQSSDICQQQPNSKTAGTIAKPAHQQRAQQRQAEQDLLKSQALLQKTLASLHEGVLLVEYATLQILDCNPAAASLLAASGWMLQLASTGEKTIATATTSASTAR